MKCIHCSYEIEDNDNFCPQCGHFTAKGYSFLEDSNNRKIIENGASNKQRERLSLLVSLFTIFVILLSIMVLIQGTSLFKPIVYLKKQIYYTINGYNPSMIISDNKYNDINVYSYNDGIYLIKKDFNEQKWQCNRDYNISKIENELETNYNIASVVLCDIPYDEVLKIKEVVDKMYQLFPNANKYLTNITVSNIDNKSIAYFQPKYQFVNVKNNIYDYNKINKTQILLNSYYFLNNNNFGKKVTDIVGEDWYVKDVTWESTIAHEFGHFISFSILLNKYNINNIVFESKDNHELINKIIDDFNKGVLSKEIVLEAYNNKSNDMELIDFAKSISNYASSLNGNGDLIYDEVIAEAIHDYYLHGMNMRDSSKEIINCISKRLEK